MDINFPPSYQKKKKQIPKYRCDICGNRKCYNKYRVTIWTHCGDWYPDPHPEVHKNDKLA